ncbi:hypothetical protein [Nocardia mexicana]|uniref:DUF8020 domain-containing protein n=1 Tax=Nocardia mexicana TaxID=279262 RepID=A0A370GL94_9NOCA|nr:hypothetical protein [Nocardia mexicana]RDI44441.1 hypothetical protein DFR68_11758 [Nocardia mexicana]
MRASKFAATALLAIGATGITAGVVHAQPTTGAPGETGMHATDHGITYTTTPTTNGHGVSTTVEAGQFTVAADARSIALTDTVGSTVAIIPLGLQTTAGTVTLTPEIGNNGRTLTLTPQSTNPQTAQAIDEASDTLARKQYNAGVGALIGAGIGAVIGFFLGGVGALVTIPVGAGLGALIGYSTP